MLDEFLVIVTIKKMYLYIYNELNNIIKFLHNSSISQKKL